MVHSKNYGKGLEFTEINVSHVCCLQAAQAAILKIDLTCLEGVSSCGLGKVSANKSLLHKVAHCKQLLYTYTMFPLG